MLSRAEEPQGLLLENGGRARGLWVRVSQPCCKARTSLLPGGPAGVLQGKQVQSWISGRRNGVLYFAFVELSEWLNEYSFCFLLTLFYKNQSRKEKLF